MHGLEVDDVRREPAVHLAEDHAASAGVAAADSRLYLVGDRGAVGPPPAVLVQPFPHHHGGGEEHVVTAGPGGGKFTKNEGKLERLDDEPSRDEEEENRRVC